MLQVCSTEEGRLSMADRLHQSFGGLRHLFHLHVVEQTTLLLTGHTWWKVDFNVSDWLKMHNNKASLLFLLFWWVILEYLLCLVDFGVIENSLLSFMAIFLPAISSYMEDRYSSGRSLLSLIPRFILMYCSFVILFFTYVNKEDQGRQ